MSEFPREIYAAPEGQFGQGVEPIKLAPWTVTPIYERSQSYVRSDIADEMLLNLRAVEVALNAVTASGLLKHSNAVLVPLLGSVRDIISKAEGRE